MSPRAPTDGEQGQPIRKPSWKNWIIGLLVVVVIALVAVIVIFATGGSEEPIPLEDDV